MKDKKLDEFYEFFDAGMACKVEEKDSNPTETLKHLSDLQKRGKKIKQWANKHGYIVGISSFGDAYISSIDKAVKPYFYIKSITFFGNQVYNARIVRDGLFCTEKEQAEELVRLFNEVQKEAKELKRYLEND